MNSDNGCMVGGLKWINLDQNVIINEQGLYHMTLAEMANFLDRVVLHHKDVSLR